MSGCGTRIVLRGQKPLALCDRCPCFGSLYPPLAALTFAASSIICAFGLASAAPRSPYRHLELCGIAFIIMAVIRRINVYDAFIDGAKEGFSIAIKIIPYLVAILVAIGVFRASGGMDILMEGIERMVEGMGFNADFVAALPTALMKPLSGSGARGMMIDTMTTYGADSFAGRLASTFQGATDTTFYIVAVYFGAVGIKNTRYAIPCGLIADAAGIVAAIIIAYLFFT